MHKAFLGFDIGTSLEDSQAAMPREMIARANNLVIFMPPKSIDCPKSNETNLTGIANTTMPPRISIMAENLNSN